MRYEPASLTSHAPPTRTAECLKATRDPLAFPPSAFHPPPVVTVPPCVSIRHKYSQNLPATRTPHSAFCSPQTRDFERAALREPVVPSRLWLRRAHVLPPRRPPLPPVLPCPNKRPVRPEWTEAVQRQWRSPVAADQAGQGPGGYNRGLCRRSRWSGMPQCAGPGRRKPEADPVPSPAECERTSRGERVRPDANEQICDRPRTTPNGTPLPPN